MKKFILKILVLIGILFILHVIATFTIPEPWVTHRVIENIRAKNQFLFPATFYPNQQLTMNEVGDLGHHTNYQVERKNITWITDKFGYRNSRYINNPDFVFIGKSFVFGGALDQDEFLPEVFGQRISGTVYNMAPSTFSQFFDRVEHGLVSLPKTLIYCSIERNIPRFKKDDGKKFIFPFTHPLLLEILVPIDKVLRSNYQKYLKSRMLNSTGRGIQFDGSKMLFLEGKDVEQKREYSEVNKHADIIKYYADSCSALGVEFIFVPIPNKETIYFEEAGLTSQPMYLSKLNQELTRRNIKTINLFERFTKDRENMQLYHFDDTHWNSNAIRIVVEELVELSNTR